jgi:hypothetical protein
MCVSAGWVLSVLGQLNATGYLVSFILMGTALALWGKSWWRSEEAGGMARRQSSRWQCYVRRFRRPFPMLFLLAALGELLGGALYHPNNYDGLTYRLPRILMWWAHSGWYWIDTPSPRMNFSGVNFEWLMLPYARLVVQRSAESGGAAESRLGVDVAPADGFLLFHRGRQHRQRYNRSQFHFGIGLFLISGAEKPTN